MYSQHYLEVMLVVIFSIWILESHTIHAPAFFPLCCYGCTNTSWIACVLLQPRRFLSGLPAQTV